MGAAFLGMTVGLRPLPRPQVRRHQPRRTSTRSPASSTTRMNPASTRRPQHRAGRPDPALAGRGRREEDGRRDAAIQKAEAAYDAARKAPRVTRSSRWTRC